MTYRLVKKFDDEDIPTILSVYKQPSISQFISIDEENYWRYITSTDNVYFYKIYKNDITLGMGSEEKRNVKSYFEDEGPFQIP